MMNEKFLKIYLDLALERQKIWYKKEISKEPKPWTTDPLFLKYFFTNVFRDQDKVSQYIIKNICTQKDPWKLLILYRYIGRVDIFKEMEGLSLKDAAHHLKTRQQQGQKVVTGAYYVRTLNGMKASEYPFYLINEIKKQEKFFNYCLRQNTIEDMTKFYETFQGVGGFMGYEYATDLTYCDCYLKAAKDIVSWANLGPGCNKGLNIIKGESFLEKKNPNYLSDMLDIQYEWIKYFSNPQFNNEPKEVIHRLRTPVMRDIEHWLCEFSKYAKYNSKGVTSKHRKYPGRF